MRIRYGMKTFLVAISIVLIASVFIYRHYLTKKTIATIRITYSIPNPSYDYTLKLESENVSKATLIVVWDAHSANPREHHFELQVNREYVLDWKKGTELTLDEITPGGRRPVGKVINPDPQRVFAGGIYIQGVDQPFNSEFMSREIARLSYDVPYIGPGPVSYPNQDSIYVLVYAKVEFDFGFQLISW